MKRLFEKVWSSIKNFVENRKKETEKEYSKRKLNKILDHCLFMMWCSYILAAFNKVEIAESLSETIARVIIGVMVSYFASKTIENVNKYGSRINKTTAEFDPLPAEDAGEDNIIVSNEEDDETYIDC